MGEFDVPKLDLHESGRSNILSPERAQIGGFRERRKAKKEAEKYAAAHVA